MLLLRHANAGEKFESPARDRVRPLDRKGQAEARRLPTVFASLRFERIVSSPHRRCVETVEPIAAARGLVVELAKELEPGTHVRKVRALLARLPDETLVCTHREVLEGLFHGQVAFEKGGAWVVERRRSRLVPVEYLAPPAKLSARPGRLVRTR